MYERAILRIGAVCLGVGLISVVVFEALHPAREDPNNNPLGRGPALSAAWAWLATAAAVTAAAAYGVLQQMTRWTPGASFPRPRDALRPVRAGHGRHHRRRSSTAGAHRLHRRLRVPRPDADAILVGTHNDSDVDRWPLVTALCRELGAAA